MRTVLGFSLAITVSSFLMIASAGAQVACTMEAKLCPDGETYVGRDSQKNCAFSPCPGEAGERSFLDVPSYHANAEAIAYVKAQGIVEGYPDGTFKPDQTINRAEFVKILWSQHWNAIPDSTKALMGVSACSFLEDSSPLLFSDVLASDWFARFICEIKGNNSIGGYPDGTFKPANLINFAEAAKIIVHFNNLETSAGHNWYEGSVRTLADTKAIPMTIHRFDQKITRGEMAEMIFRLDTGNNDKPSRTYEELVVLLPNQIMTITLYFGDTQKIIDESCAATKLVLRTIPKTTSVADTTLSVLLKGVTPAEEKQGLTSLSFQNSLSGDSQPLSAYYQGVTIANSVATVKFTGGATAYLHSTSCVQESVKNPIERTLLQFPSIKSVRYSIDGEIITDWDG